MGEAGEESSPPPFLSWATRLRMLDRKYHFSSFATKKYQIIHHTIINKLFDSAISYSNKQC